MSDAAIRRVRLVLRNGAIPPGRVPQLIPYVQPVAFAQWEDGELHFDWVDQDYQPVAIPMGAAFQMAVRRNYFDVDAPISVQATITNPDGGEDCGFFPLDSSLLGSVEVAIYVYDADYIAPGGERQQALPSSPFAVLEAVVTPGTPVTPGHAQPPLGQGPAGQIAVVVGTSTLSASVAYFSNSNGLSFGMSGSTITGSVAPSAGGAALSAGGQSQNTGTIVFANSNGVSFGLSNGSITATVTPGAAAGIAAVEAGTQTATSGSVVFGNSNGVSFGLSAGTITASINPPTGGVAIGAGTESTNSGTVSFANSNGISFGMSGGSQITGSVAPQTTQPGIQSLSAGTTRATTGEIIFADANGLSFGLDGQTMTGSYTVPVVPAQTSVSFSNSNNVSFGLAGSTLTASASYPAQTTQPAANLAAGTQTATSGTVAFANSNGLSFGMSGSSQITASYSQSTAPSGIAAGTATASSGVVDFADSNGLSFGMSAGTITATYAAIRSLSAGTTRITNGEVIFSDSNGVSFGMSAGTLTAAVPAQTPFGLSAGTQSVSTGTLVLSNSNNVSFGMSASSVVTATVTVPAVSAISAIAAGSQTATAGTIAFANSNGISFGMSGSSQLTGSYTVPTQSVQPGIAAISGGSQVATTGTVFWSNSNNVSFGLGSGASTSIMTASASYSQSTAPAGVAVNGGAATTNGTILFSNSNGVTFGGNGSTITAAYSQSTAPGGFSAGTQLGTSGTLSFSNANGISFGLSGSATLTASYTVPTETPFGLSAGTQSVSTGTLVLSNSNGISFGMSGSSRITASYTTPVVSNALQDIGTATGSGTATSQFAAQDHVHRGVVGLDVNGIASTFYGEVQLSAGNLMSLATGGASTAGSVQVINLLSSSAIANPVSSVSSAGTLASRYALADHAHAGLNSVSVVGNTAGATTAGAGSVVFAGGPNVTLSAGTAAGGMTISVSAGAPGTTGITGLVAGTQTATRGSVSFADSNGISFGASGSSQITASYIPGALGVSTDGLGNTGSQTQGTFYLSGSAGVQLSMITGAASQHTIAIGEAVQSRMSWGGIPGLITSSGITVSQASLQYFSLAAPVSFSRVDVPMLFSFGSTTTSNTAAVAFTSGAIIYSRNGSTLNPIVGQNANTTYSYASNSANFSSVQSGRLVSFALATQLNPGEYFLYLFMSTATSSVGAATTNLGATVSVLFGSTFTASGFADFGALSGATTGPIAFGPGVISSSVSNTTQTLQMSQMTVTGTAVRANTPFILRNF